MSIFIDSVDKSALVESVTNRTDIEIKSDETAFPTLYVATVFGKWNGISSNCAI